MEKKLIFALLFVLLLFPLVSSDNLGTFKQYDNVTVRANLEASFVNVTIYYPNSSVAVENQSMQNVFGNIWNYNFSNTNTLGVYGFDYCDENGNNCSANTFELTGTGFPFTVATSIIYVGLLFLLAFFFTITIGGISWLPSKDARDEEGAILEVSNLKYLRTILFVVGWMLLMAMTFIGANIGFAYLGSTLVANILFDLYQIMMLLTLPMVVIWFLWIFVKIFRDKEMRNLIDRGGGIDVI
jgi:hypothetical protein